MTDAGDRSPQTRSRTLEYKQAMKDFHTMFPTLEKDIIECVLRSNSGHVDSTIDQLLQLTQDMAQNNRNVHSYERLYYTFEESSSSTESIPSELRGPPTSSDEDHPPRYTPDHDPPPSFSSETSKSFSARRFRDWNPPLLGTLPDDFLRILPGKPNGPMTKVPTRQHHPRHNRTGYSSRAPPTHSSLAQHNSLRRTADGPRQVHFHPHTKLQRRKTTGNADQPLRAVNSHRHHSPQRRMVKVDEPQDREPRFPLHQRRSSAPSSHSRQRSNGEQSQYVEDRKVALMLQNEEFLRELRRNEEFLHKLNKEAGRKEPVHPGFGDVTPDARREEPVHPRDKFQPISVDPLKELPPEIKKGSNIDRNESSEEINKDFKESLKHMNKSARKSFSEIARKFNARRKSYKSMNDTLDPVFANCDDERR